MTIKLLNSNYTCNFSKIAFKSIVDSLSVVPLPISTYVKFVDGDSYDIHNDLQAVYNMRRNDEAVFMITLIGKNKSISPIIWHMSDCVVEKNISYIELQNIIKVMITRKPKIIEDSVFGDIMGDIFKASKKERSVLELLMEGHSQIDVSNLLNISTKTVSAYKSKSVKRYGVRNFNELYIQWLQHLP